LAADRAARAEGLAVGEVPPAVHLPAEAVRREGEGASLPAGPLFDLDAG